MFLFLDHLSKAEILSAVATSRNRLASATDVAGVNDTVVYSVMFLLVVNYLLSSALFGVSA